MSTMFARDKNIAEMVSFDRDRVLEDEALYHQRTIEHIHRVHNNMVILVVNFSKELALKMNDRRKLMHQVLNHDRSKYSIDQFIPYIALTKFYYERKKLGNKDYKYPHGMAERVDLAVDHHYVNENHHPERLAGQFSMTKLEAIETACDLQAMSDEFGEGSFRDFYDNVWKPKQGGNFISDNFLEVTGWMEKCLQCFETHHGITYDEYTTEFVNDR